MLNLQSTDWEPDVNCQSVDEMYNSFINKFTNIYNQSFPLKRVDNKRKNVPRKPWITPGLANSCHKKEKLYKRFIKNKPPLTD